jgi:osmotically-inducible protein OsmY
MRLSFHRWGAPVLAVGLALMGVWSSALANPGIVGDGQARERVTTDPVVDRVHQAIRRELRDAVYEITILNSPDAITLRGEVDTEETRHRAVSVAHAAAGKRVRDEMRLRPSLTDEQIASQVRTALSQEYPDIASRIDVDVREGVAYLSGDLRNHRQVDELLATTLMVAGVRDIRSDITLSGRSYGGARMRVGR